MHTLMCVCLYVCVSSIQQGVSGASAASSCRGCRCLGSIVLRSTEVSARVCGPRRGNVQWAAAFLIFLPALFLKERKTGGWGGPQGSEDTNSHSVWKWKSYTEGCSWLPPGDSGLGDSAPHPPPAHLMRKEKPSLVRVTVTPTKPWKCPPPIPTDDEKDRKSAGLVSSSPPSTIEQRLTPSGSLWGSPNSQQTWASRSPSTAPASLFMIFLFLLGHFHCKTLH